MLFRLLAVGDVVGAPGLDFAAKNLKRIRKELGADFVVVNGETPTRITPSSPPTPCSRAPRPR